LKKYDGYALITGGSSGIGLAFAHELAARGYDLVLVARDKAKLTAAKKSIQTMHSVKVITLSQDLTKGDSADKIYKFLHAKKIHIGLLVNNAGFGSFGYFHQQDRMKTLHMINTMCLGYTDLTYRLIPAMLERSSGGIIFISSILALVPGPLLAVYAASKAYVLKLGISLHIEYGSKGIDVLTVCPGPIDTNFYRTENIPKPKTNLLPPSVVAKKSLKALGNKIAISVPSDLLLRILPILNKLLSLKIMEKLTKKAYKDLFNVDL
jgi:short-subunit dehydrogenase